MSQPKLIWHNESTARPINGVQLSDARLHLYRVSRVLNDSKAHELHLVQGSAIYQVH
jgi:hypothetical protein